MTLETAVTRQLNDLGIAHSIHIHDKPLRSLEQAAAERGLQHDQIVRSLLFRLENRHFVLVLVAGPGKVSWSKLRRFLGVRRLTTANDSEVQDATGFEPGAVSPIGLKNPLRILADQGLKQQEIISIGAGIRNAGVILGFEDLLSAIQVEFADFLER